MSKRISFKCFTLLFMAGASFISIHSFAQSFADTAAIMEKVFERYKAQNPGAQLSVSRGGQIIFSKGWGMSDLEHNIPMSTTVVTEAGSVSKQFTAACVLLLEQQGKLSLNDNIRKYLPEIPNYGKVIRIRHLMHHTSGIKDWGYVADIGGWARGTRTYRNEDALEIIARQKTLNNMPGEEYIYSNSGFNLLAIIIQRAGGVSLAEFSKQYIFTPAGMTHTEWRDDFKRIVPNRAMAYEKAKSGYRTDMPNEYVYGNGGLITTTEDLCKWVDFFKSGKLGGPALLQKQIAPDTFNNGNLHYYGAGLRILKRKGYTVFRHEGATASYRASLEYFPELDLTIAGLSNTSEFDSSTIDVFGKTEDVFLPKKITDAPALPVVDVTPAKLRTYAGIYRNDRSGEALKISNADGKLMAGRLPLTPLNENSFLAGADRLQFTPGGLTFTGSDKNTLPYTRVDSALITPAILNAYAGEYASAEAGSVLRIAAEQAGLRIYLHPYQSYLLKPLYKDGFTAEGFGAVLYFEKNAKGISGFKISNARARNVSFTKVAAVRP